MKDKVEKTREKGTTEGSIRRQEEVKLRLNLQTGVVICFVFRRRADAGGTTGRQLACVQGCLIYGGGSSRTSSGGEVAGAFSACTADGFQAAGPGEESRLRATALPGENSTSHARCFKTDGAQNILTVRRRSL